jgi:hypothetical protein
MANTTQGLIPYSSRDYDSIIADFWELVPQLTDLWRPEADADPGVVLGKILASAADMLNVNIDYLASELFAPSVVQRKDAEKIFALIGYDLGFYTAARTEVTFTNNTSESITLDFGFNGANFCTLNAYTDITNTSRVITYNLLPMTSGYGQTGSRSRRSVLSQDIDVFAESDIVTIKSGESCTRVAVEGDLRSYSVAVSDVKKNNYVITLPSQHVDTTALWIRGRTSLSATSFDKTQWKQVATTAEFDTPEPRYAVTYDNYSNAQITISNYLNQLANYEGYYLTIFWIDCSGVIGCVGTDVLTNPLFAKPQSNNWSFTGGDILISNLSNTVELPHTYTVTGKSPETAKEAYYTSRNYINTWDSLVTLPDYTRFLRREAGVDCGVVIDCQKALEINMAIYNDDNLTTAQKQKKYITYHDFPQGVSSNSYDWSKALGLGFDPADPQKFVFATNFKNYTAMCFAVHNDFKNSIWGEGQISTAQISNTVNFRRYKPPQMFIDNVVNDFAPLQAMSVELQFGYCRVFDFYVVGQIYTNKPVSVDVGEVIISKVKEALALYYAPSNRDFNMKPTVMEIVNLIRTVDDRITYFDAGSPTNPVITWSNCDPEYFNPISIACYNEPSNASGSIRIAPECLIR